MCIVAHSRQLPKCHIFSDVEPEQPVCSVDTAVEPVIFPVKSVLNMEEEVKATVYLISGIHLFLYFFFLPPPHPHPHPSFFWLPASLAMLGGGGTQSWLLNVLDMFTADGSMSLAYLCYDT